MDGLILQNKDGERLELNNICVFLYVFRLTAAYSNSLYSSHSCNVIYQLQAVSSLQESRKNKRISPDMKETFSSKNISSCFLIVACVMVLSIPTFVYIGLRINSPETKNTSDNATLALIWTSTIALMNCTFNCLIFYWKNNVLRTEGWKVLKSMTICRRVEF
jgi:hypothetical protein